MSKPKPTWKNVQITYEIWRKVRSLAFPDDLEHREVCTAALECVFENPELIKKVLAKVKEKTLK